VALETDDTLPRAVISAPRAVAERWPEPRQRALAGVAAIVTETPWRLSRAIAGPLDDDALLHTIALASFFGHLNRIADAVAVPLDYQVRIEPPHAEPATPALLPAPGVLGGGRALELERRPATAAALASWRSYLMDHGSSTLSRERRAMIEHRVATLLGAPVELVHEPSSQIDHTLLALAELVTLAPWRLDDHAFAPLRDEGFTDAALFETCAVASSAGVWARIAVATVAVGR
jgi:alkylhydroperoxidase family enzyme